MGVILPGETTTHFQTFTHASQFSCAYVTFVQVLCQPKKLTQEGFGG